MRKMIAVLSALLICISLTACGDRYTAQDLQDAKQRYASGKYTREDERMVEGFYKWKADQDKYID